MKNLNHLALFLLLFWIALDSGAQETLRDLTYSLPQSSTAKEVSKNTEKLAIKEITTKLMDYKMKALRDSFKSEDFLNPSITISLNMDNDYLYATIQSFKNNIFSTYSNQILLSPQKEADNIAPELYLIKANDYTKINQMGFNNVKDSDDVTKKYYSNVDEINKYVRSCL